jgi:ABC-type antimicrobial peptide transport system ATPase subunit
MLPLQNNTLLEALGKINKYNCIAVAEGCKFMSSSATELKNHMETCRRRFVACPFCNYNKCKQTSDMIRHIEIEHRKTVQTCNDIKTQYKFEMIEGQCGQTSVMWKINNDKAVIVTRSPTYRNLKWAEENHIWAQTIGHEHNTSRLLSIIPVIKDIGTNTGKRLNDLEKIYHIPEFNSEKNRDTLLTRQNPAIYGKNDIQVDNYGTRCIIMGIKEVESKKIFITNIYI